MKSLIVYGAGCTWWDSIENAGKKASGLPCCPHCGSVLFQVSRDEWDAGVTAYEVGGNPGYVDKINWMRGQCFKNVGDAYAAYSAAQDGKAAP